MIAVALFDTKLEPKLILVSYVDTLVIIQVSGSSGETVAPTFQKYPFPPHFCPSQNPPKHAIS